MENLKLKIDLSKLRGAQVVKGKDGNMGLWLPIEMAGLFLSQKTGSVYLDIEMYAKKAEYTQYSLHDIRQSTSKEFREQWLKELQAKDANVKYVPYIGSSAALNIPPKQTQENATPQQAQDLAKAIGGADAEGLPF